MPSGSRPCGRLAGWLLLLLVLHQQSSGGMLAGEHQTGGGAIDLALDLINTTANHSLPGHTQTRPGFIQTTLVGVYGTLKKGQPNHHRMMDPTNGEAEFLGAARTVEKYPLVITGKHNIPFLLNIPGEGQRVRGEIYRVDDRMLTFLDAFEGVPATYQRVPHQLEVEEWSGRGATEDGPSKGDVVEVFMYSTTTYQPEWPSLPNYESYDSYGAHGLDYVAREGGD